MGGGRGESKGHKWRERGGWRGWGVGKGQKRGEGDIISSYDWFGGGGGGGQAGRSAATYTQGAVRFSLHRRHTSCVMATIFSDEIMGTAARWPNSGPLDPKMAQ